MSAITLHRASRIQDQVRTAVRALKLPPHATISIFAEDPREEFQLRAEKLINDIGHLERLLEILGTVRAAVGKANGELGVSALLAEKAQLEEWCSLVEKTLATEPARRGWGEAQLTASAGSNLHEQISATRKRFEHGEGAVSELLVDLLDDDARERLGARIAQKRRRLEEISEVLRGLNSGKTIEIEDEQLKYLREHNVF